MRQIKMIRFYIGRIMRNLAVFIRWGIFSAFVGLFVGAFSTLFAFCLRQVTSFRTENPWLILCLPLAAEYTFFLAIPVMFGASLLKLVKFGFHFTGEEAAILIIGMIVAFVVSLIVIKFLMGYIKKHNFIVFGWYRIVLGAIVLLCGIAGLL